MEASTKGSDLLSTVSEQMMALEKRNWEAWLVFAGIGIVFGIGALALLFRAAFLRHGLLHVDLSVSPELFFGFVALLIVYNTYMMNRRLRVRRLRKQVISTTIQSELVRLQSFADPLTEVYNRRALDEIARRFISRARRLNKPLTFMMADIDRFKEVNTRYGHLMGDFVLTEVAIILKRSVRGSDAVVRYGGDEFLVILADTNSQGGQVVVDRISKFLAEWNAAEHLKNFELALSIGLTESSEDKTLDGLLDEADQAMYSTKALRKEPPRSVSQTLAARVSSRASSATGN